MRPRTRAVRQTVFAICIGDIPTGYAVAAPSLRQLLQRLGLQRCVVRHRRRPFRLWHTHVHPPARAFDPTPIEKGGHVFWVLRLPFVGEIHYRSDLMATEEPTLTFQKICVVHLPPAPK